MSTDAPGLEGQDQPEVAVAPDTGTSQEQGLQAPFSINEVPEEYREHVERYNRQIQGAYTKKTQELASERQQYEQQSQFVTRLQSDPEFQAQYLQSLGYEIQQDDPTLADQFDPQVMAALQQYHEQNVQPLMAFLQEQSAQEQQNATATEIGGYMDSKLDELGIPENKDNALIREWIISRALALPPSGRLADGTPLPDVDSAVKQFQDQLSAEVNKRYVASKRAPRVQAGRPGQAKVDLSDEEQRTAHMLAIAQAASEGG